MASKGLSIPQLKGSFELRGIVTGVTKDNFYTEKKTKDGKKMWRGINFGLKINHDETVFLQFNGMESENVFFYGKKNKDDKKGETITVPWKDRLSFKKDGYRLIGVNVGLEKTLDDKGKEVNDKKVLHQYDAAKYVSENLEDGQSVFVKGNIEYSSYTNTNTGELSHSVKFVPNQISLCKDIDFDVVDLEGKPYETIANFTQPIVFMGIEKENEGDKFSVQAKIVNFNTIEDAEFTVEDAKLANNFRKNVKPYSLINTWGNIRSVKNADVVEEESSDGWGDPNPMNRVFASYKVARILTGADPTSIDKETYSEDKMELAYEEVKKLQNKEKAFDAPAVTNEWGGAKPTEKEDEW